MSWRAGRRKRERKKEKDVFFCNSDILLSCNNYTLFISQRQKLKNDYAQKGGAVYSWLMKRQIQRERDINMVNWCLFAKGGKIDFKGAIFLVLLHRF